MGIPLPQDTENNVFYVNFFKFWFMCFCNMLVFIDLRDSDFIKRTWTIFKGHYNIQNHGCILFG